MINQVELQYKKKKYMVITPMIFKMFDDGMNKIEVQQYLKKIGIEPDTIKGLVNRTFQEYERRIF